MNAKNGLPPDQQFRVERMARLSSRQSSYLPGRVAVVLYSIPAANSDASFVTLLPSWLRPRPIERQHYERFPR
jgi:hypothetical protein